MTKYVFITFSGTKLLKVKVFTDYTKMKVFSSKYSKMFGSKIPDYNSTSRSCR